MLLSPNRPPESEEAIKEIPIWRWKRGEVADMRFLFYQHGDRRNPSRRFIPETMSADNLPRGTNQQRSQPREVSPSLNRVHLIQG